MRRYLISPPQFISQNGIKTEPLTKGENSNIQIPNVSVQDIHGNSSIFISLGNDQYALRFIKVLEKNGSYSFTDSNVRETEMVITNGAPLIKAGFLRMQSGYGGHSHSH